LEKAPGGSVTKDTVFNNAEYTRQFLTNLYGMQYYGLPYKNVANQESSNNYVGKPEALTDLYIYTYPSAGITGPYYQGTHTANYGKRSDKSIYYIFSFDCIIKIKNQVSNSMNMFLSADKRENC